ncbi:MAG: HAMP domain-containing protein, partial [Planctomycetota bacterium]
MKSIRSKILAGIVFLFVLILILSILGITFIHQISKQFKGTLVENYRTIDYTTNMLQYLEDIHLQNHPAQQTQFQNASAQIDFEKNLQLETDNITEFGEKELVQQVHIYYQEYIQFLNPSEKRNDPFDLQQLKVIDQKHLQLRKTIIEIYQLNMNAIFGKTRNAEQIAKNAIFYMCLVVAISIILTITFILTFPSQVIKPIQTLTEKIIAISEKDYNQQISLESSDEIGTLAKAFNTMAVRLKEYEEK